MAIEASAGAVRKQVELLVRHLVPGGVFSSSTFPSTEDVELAIATAESEILQWFSNAGYSLDLASWSDVAKEYVSRYNALGAAYFLELAHGGLIFSETSSTRADGYFKLYISLADRLKAGESFVQLGIPKSAIQLPVQIGLTGVSKAERLSLTSDPDFEKPFFNRKIFRHPGSLATQEQLERT